MIICYYQQQTQTLVALWHAVCTVTTIQQSTHVVERTD